MVADAQREFDGKYITSFEIYSTLKINRSSLWLAISSGRLPKPITVKRGDGQPFLQLWLRTEMEPILSEWSKSVARRKGL